MAYTYLKQRHSRSHKVEHHAEAHEIITYQESRVCLKVIELCNRKSIAVLPIHDSFIVKNQHRDALEVIMAKAYELLDFQSVPMVIDE